MRPVSWEKLPVALDGPRRQNHRDQAGQFLTTLKQMLGPLKKGILEQVT